MSEPIKRWAVWDIRTNSFMAENLHSGLCYVVAYDDRELAQRAIAQAYGGDPRYEARMIATSVLSGQARRELHMVETSVLSNEPSEQASVGSVSMRCE